MENLKEKLNNWKFIILIIIFVAGLFYWFQIKPELAKKKCIRTYPYAFGPTSTKYDPGSYLKSKTDKSGYEKCLREHGLEK